MKSIGAIILSVLVGIVFAAGHTGAQEMKKTVRRLAIKLTRLLIGVVGGGIDVQDTSAVGTLSRGRA